MATEQLFASASEAQHAKACIGRDELVQRVSKSMCWRPSIGAKTDSCGCRLAMTRRVFVTSFYRFHKCGRIGASEDGLSVVIVVSPLVSLMADQVLLWPHILCLFIFRIFSYKNFTVKFTIKYSRMLRMREQSVAGLLFFLQRPVEEASWAWELRFISQWQTLSLDCC